MKLMGFPPFLPGVGAVLQSIYTVINSTSILHRLVIHSAMDTRHVNAQYNASFHGHLLVRLTDEFIKWCFTLYRTAVVESSPCMREIGVRSPVETDPSR